MSEIEDITKELETIGKELVTCLARTEQLEDQIEAMENELDDKIATVGALTEEVVVYETAISYIKYMNDEAMEYCKHASEQEKLVKLYWLMGYIQEKIIVVERAL